MPKTIIIINYSKIESIKQIKNESDLFFLKKEKKKEREREKGVAEKNWKKTEEESKPLIFY